MIVLLIAVIWIATLTVVVEACRMAAHGDRASRRGSIATVAGRSPRLLDTAGPQPGALVLRLEDRRQRAVTRGGHPVAHSSTAH
jgi:hypothetical protein